MSKAGEWNRSMVPRQLTREELDKKEMETARRDKELKEKMNSDKMLEEMRKNAVVKDE